MAKKMYIFGCILTLAFSPLVAEAHTPSEALVLKCEIGDRELAVVLSEQFPPNDNAQLIIYEGGKQYLAFANYETTDQQYAAMTRFRIGDFKKLTRLVIINRINGDIMISQTIDDGFGKTKKDKKHKPFRLEGNCVKGEAIHIPKKF